jgi:azurin/nucleoside 2-deoxyribosyltransferase
MNRKYVLTLAIAATLSLAPLTASRAADDAPAAAPTLTLDKNPKIIAYQLKRHTNPQLIAIDRTADDPKFRPVYEALLTRKGLEKKYREEAVTALATIDKSDAVVVLLDGIAKVDAEDKNTPRELAALLMAQKPATLAAQKDKLTALAKESESATVKQAAYAALVTADGKPDAAWQLATENAGLPALLAGVPMITSGKVRESFYVNVKPLIEKAPDDAARTAAIEIFGSIPGHETETFNLLAAAFQKNTGDKQAAAVRSLGRIPASKWPKDQLEPLAQAILKFVEATPAEQRTTPALVQTVQLGNDLAGALPPDKGAPIRKSLRGLAVRVVLIQTLPEQMMYDLRYFTVQAGKPVQVILDNTDTMPHNVVVTAPGAYIPIALAAGAMTQPDDPAVKPFVPADPKVLQATHLVPPGESETLKFTAPAKPGNYTFFCSYPGHYIKMYGTMQVVADLDEYDKNPVVPKDPNTHKPYESQKNESQEGATAEHHH